MPLRFFQLLTLVCAFVFAFIPVSAEENPVFFFPFEQKVTFDPYPDSQQRITNDLLQYIAEGSNRLRSMTSYTMTGKISVSLDSLGNETFLARISLDELTIAGDVNYRDFSLIKVLIPDLLKATLLFKLNDGQVLFSADLNSWPIRGAESVYRVEFKSEKTIGPATAVLDGIRLGYSESTYQRLDDWFGFLEDYYAAGNALEQTEASLARLDFSDPAMLILDEFRLCEAEIKMAVLGREAFFTQLGPQAGDPEGIFGRYDKLVNHVKFLREDFNKKMAVADSLLYVSGLNFLTSGQQNEARERFESSLVLNPFFVPSHLGLAEIDLAVGKKENSIQRLGEVFSVIRPHGKWREASEVLTDSVMAQFFREAYQLNREGRFKESLDLLAPLERFCEKVADDFECPYEMKYRLNQTHLGMYRSFLVVGGRALRNDNLSLCRTYVSSALEYQQNNREFIADAREALDLLQQCVYRYIEISGVRFAEGDLSGSFKSLEGALELCNQIDGVFCPEDLNQRQQMISELLESGGSTSLTQGNSLLESSGSISMETTVEPAAELKEEISQLQFLAWAGNLDNAKQGQEKVLETIQQLGLENNVQVVAEMEKLREMILSKECELAQREINGIARKGMSYLEYAEYRLAYQYGMQIREIMESLPRCELSLDKPAVRLFNLGPAIQFLDKVEAADSLFSSTFPEKYPQVLKLYYEAQMFFNEHELSQQGMTPPDLLRFITSSDNPELARAGVMFMAEHPETYASEMVSLLWHLKDQGSSPSDTRSVQEFAGRKLALFLSSKDQGAQPESMLFSLTMNDHWFRFFEKSFRENWTFH